MIDAPEYENQGRRMSRLFVRARPIRTSYGYRYPLMKQKTDAPDGARFVLGCYDYQADITTPRFIITPSEKTYLATEN